MKKGCLAVFLLLSIDAAFASGQEPSASNALPTVPMPWSPSQIIPASASATGATSQPSSASSVPQPAAPAPELLPMPVPLSTDSQSPNPGLLPYPTPVPPAPLPNPIIVNETGIGFGRPVDFDGGSRLWIQMDYLLWFIKNGPLSVPLATTGNANDANPGALGQPGTQVLYGNSNINYGAFSGGRLSVGDWIDSEARFGIEANAFFLSQQRTGFSAFSDNGGNPIISVPIFNAQTQKEDQVPVAIPGYLAGGVVVSSSSMLWGAELNGSLNLCRCHGFQVDLLAGFRFLDLHEDLNIQTPDVNISPSSSQGGGNIYNTVDDFRTGNQFYGGQIGSRISYRWDRLSVDMTGMVALGSTYQSIDINGYSAFAPSAGSPPQFSPGGIFAQPTNMGHYCAWDFGVVPQGQLRIGYEVYRNVQLSAGYDFLYWSSVVRPGAQLDRTVNLSQNSLLSSSGNGTLSGPAQPTVPLARSDIFAHGLTLGLEVQW